MATYADKHSHASHDHAAHAHHDERPSGIKRWLFTTNHKDIGTLYLVFACIMFFIGGAFAMVIRAELFKPGLQIVDPGLFNEFTTLHALVMSYTQGTDPKGMLEDLKRLLKLSHIG